MVDGLGRTVSRFLLWCLFYCAVAVVGNLVGSITGSDEAMSWTMLSGFVLMTVVYLGKHYVELSFGRIERRAASVGISALIASAYVLVMVSVFTLIDIEHLFRELQDCFMVASSVRYWRRLAFVVFFLEDCLNRGAVLGWLS